MHVRPTGTLRVLLSSTFSLVLLCTIGGCSHLHTGSTPKVSCIQTAAATSPAVGGYASSERSVSSSIEAHSFVSRDSVSQRLSGYVLIVRGADSWAVSSSAHGSVGVAGLSESKGGVEYHVQHDFGHGTIVVAGVPVGLDTANIILLDHVDRTHEGATVRTLGCISLDPPRTMIDRALAVFRAAPQL